MIFYRIIFFRREAYSTRVPSAGDIAKVHF